MTRSPKPKKCKLKGCGQIFTPSRPMQCVCSPDCARELARQKREQEERKETRAKLKSLEGLPVLKARAQAAINGYVRARDAGKGCISCGRPLLALGVGGGFDAGHLRSIGSAAHLRFDLRNINGQCKHCNNYLAGNPHGYRAGYIERFGSEALAELEADNEARHHTKTDLIQIAADYRRMTREVLKND
jgi:hypothetical protein